MMKPKAEADYEAALAHVEMLMDAAPSQHIVWAWYPGGWQLCRMELDWDEAVKAYWEAKADMPGPVYLTEIKRVKPKADWICLETNYKIPGGSGYCTCRVFQPGSSFTAILCKHCGKPSSDE